MCVCVCERERERERERRSQGKLYSYNSPASPTKKSLTAERRHSVTLDLPATASSKSSSTTIHNHNAVLPATTQRTARTCFVHTCQLATCTTKRMSTVHGHNHTRTVCEVLLTHRTDGSSPCIPTACSTYTRLQTWIHQLCKDNLSEVFTPE